MDRCRRSRPWAAGSRLAWGGASRQLGLALFALAAIPLALGVVTWAAAGRAGRWWLVGCLPMAGVGNGLYGVGVQTAALEALPPHEAGVAAGVYSTCLYIGSIVGSSV